MKKAPAKECLVAFIMALTQTTEERKKFVFGLVAFVLLALPSLAQDRTAAPKEARVYVVSPQDGETLAGPVTIQFGLEGMGVTPAGV